ncbi:MAG TPA: hypothetical protein PKN75_09200 [Bacteroidia bacterium]|nr:hypothetical protein [Bacteroidia bacterium]HNU33757.1 hypothetical protein [Bacteroidia bacterium]
MIYISRNWIFYLSVLFISVLSFDVTAQPDYKTELKSLGDSIFRGSTDSVRVICSNRTLEILGELLKNPTSFTENFDSIKTLSTLHSPDKTLRFYQWALPVMETNSYKIFGFIQTYNHKKKSVEVYQLKDIEADKYEAMDKKLSPEKCYNAVYYKIIETKFKKNKYYTLLGWRGNNLLTTIKVIDVLSFENSKPVFGAKIFEASNYQLTYGDINKKYRIIFEYNAQAVMTLRYEQKMKTIVYDHLSASKSSLKGMEQFMGPDFTYDGFKWKKGKWKGKTNLEMKNSTSQTKKDFKIFKDSDLK